MKQPIKIRKTKKTEVITLATACKMLGISEATGKNWLRLGKLNAKDSDTGKLIYKHEVEKLLLSLKKDDSNVLKSRRNKTALKGRELYVNYVSRESPNHAAVALLVSGFTGSTTAITALLCESFLQLLVDAKRIKSNCNKQFFRAYLEGTLDADIYDWLLLELMDKTSRNTLLSASKKLPYFTLHFVPFEDTLGLIYLSLMELSKRRQSGRYYTPQSLTDTAVETLQVARGRVFLDPCCGSGNFLLRLLRRGARVEDLYGCDLDGFSVTLARINFVLSGNCSDKDTLQEHLLKCDTITCRSLPQIDVVLGNPPWGSCDDEKVVSRYARTLICAEKKRPCFADLFVERSLNLLKDGGIVQFVLPEALLNVASHETIRSFITEHARVRSVRYLGEVFHAVQCPSVILTLEKTSFSNASGDVIVNVGDSNYIVRRQRKGSDFNFKVTDQEALVLDKMDDLEHCVKLKGHAKFALGIVTGSNNNSIFKQKIEGSEAVLRGLDIEPFKINPPDSFIKYEEGAFQQVAPMELYRAKEKLVYRFIAKYPIVAVDTHGMLTLNSCNLLVPEFKDLSATYLAAVLNSSAVRFYFEKKFHTIKILRSLLEEVPVPVASKEDQMYIEFLVEELKDADEATSKEIIKKIDRKIAEIYGLGKRALKLISQV
ncbi:MAG: N-6 DNA methylase [Succinivibrio sp.]|jgi:type I restriction-modification system DNA methylase subunit|nr:N-6 DNA methylase [Succinivibrio sp.]